MPDSRFHHRSGAFALGELAEIAGAKLGQGADPAKVIEDVAPLDQAGPSALSFLDNVRYKDQFAVTRAGACIVTPEMRERAPVGLALLLTPQPYKAYALVAQTFYPERKPEPSIATGAFVHPDASVGKGSVIEHGAYIGEGAEIGEGCWIEANAVVGARVKLGKGCRVGANSSISHTLAGDNIRLYPGVRIGQDGFGFAMDPAGHVKVPQLGRVIIEDSVEIGANTTIDRGSGPDTVIGRGTWIDNLVQIGHNVRIGRGCVIVAQVGISGSTVIDDYAVLAGQVGVAGHLHIGKGAMVAAQSGVAKDVPAGDRQMGSPARPAREYMKQAAALQRLAKKETRS